MSSEPPDGSSGRTSPWSCSHCGKLSAVVSAGDAAVAATPPTALALTLRTRLLLLLLLLVPAEPLDTGW